MIHINEHWNKEGVKTALSAETYIKNSVAKFEHQLDKKIGKSKTPMSEGDHSELNG